jgi:hypothetical protein
LRGERHSDRIAIFPPRWDQGRLLRSKASVQHRTINNQLATGTILIAHYHVSQYFVVESHLISRRTQEQRSVKAGASVPRAGGEVRLFDSAWAFVLLVLYIYIWVPPGRTWLTVARSIRQPTYVRSTRKCRAIVRGVTRMTRRWDNLRSGEPIQDAVRVRRHGSPAEVGHKGACCQISSRKCSCSCRNPKGADKRVATAHPSDFAIPPTRECSLPLSGESLKHSHKGHQGHNDHQSGRRVAAVHRTAIRHILFPKAVENHRPPRRFATSR